MVTSLYLGILGILYFKITMAVIKGRHTHKIYLGAKDNKEMIYLTSAHNNFASYTPLFLISIFVLEAQSTNIYILHILSIVFVTGRIIHYLTMKDQEKTFRKRKFGMQLTMIPLMMSFILNIICFVKAQLILLRLM